MDKNEAIAKVKAYKSLLDGVINYENVYLFGSYAKDNQRPESDIDVAVIVNGFDADILDLNLILWKLRRNIDLRIEPKIIDRSNDFSGLWEEIQLTGIKIN